MAEIVEVRELVVVSGRGGPGAARLSLALAAHAAAPVLVEAAGDAVELVQALEPRELERHDFPAGNVAVVRQADCSGCGVCLARCRFGAIRRESDDGAAVVLGAAAASCDDCPSCSRSCPAKLYDQIALMQAACGGPARVTYAVDPVTCEGCGVCVRACPLGAIDFPSRPVGAWLVSSTRLGPLIHARLQTGGGSSEFVVAVLRREARRVALEQGRRTVIVVAPPGSGAAVVASLTGATLALVVTEPSPSGGEDGEAQLLSVARGLDVATAQWRDGGSVAALLERWG